MTTVRVDYHREGTSWWADSPDLDGFVASGDSLTEVRQLVWEGLPFYLDAPAATLDIVEASPSGTPVVTVTFVTQGTIQPTFTGHTDAYAPTNPVGYPGVAGVRSPAPRNVVPA